MRPLGQGSLPLVQAQVWRRSWETHLPKLTPQTTVLRWAHGIKAKGSGGGGAEGCGLAVCN